MNGGPYLGSNLQPPVFRSYYEATSSGSNNFDGSRLQRIEESIETLAQMQQKESSKKVFVSQRDISNAQNEYQKQTEIAKALGISQSQVSDMLNKAKDL